MSQPDNPFDSKRLPIVFIIAGIIVLGGFSGAVGVGGGSCTPSYSQGCANHISFDSTIGCSVQAACPLGTNTTSLTLPSVTPGDLVTVFADQYWAANPPPGHITVQSVKDSAGDIYTRQILHLVPLVSAQFDNGMEIWTAFTNASSLTVTIKTNVTLGVQQSIDLVAAYKNVMQVASVNATDSSGQLLNNISQNIVLSGSSSWIVGSVFNDDNSACATPTSPVPITQRTVAVGAGLNCGDIADTNAPVLKTASNFNFSEGITGGPNFALAQIELSPTFVDQPTECTASQIGNVCPLPSNVCTPVNGLCATSINSVRLATAPTALNQVLTLNQVYCTGITTAALTTSKTDTVLMAGTYGGVSLNQTGAKMLVQFKIGTTAPSTVFGSGSCAAGSTVGTMDLTFSVSGPVSATTAYSAAISASPSETANTYYGWFEITPQNFVGHLNYDQVVNQAYCFASIFMQEEK